MGKKKRFCISCKRSGVDLNKDDICRSCYDFDEHRRVSPSFGDTCIRCGYNKTPVDEHHIHGRKNSDSVIPICSNCHRELHAGQWRFEESSGKCIDNNIKTDKVWEWRKA